MIQNNSKMETSHVQNLEDLKSNIEKMTKTQQLEVLKILHENPDVKLNENKSGVYVNLSFLPEKVLTTIQTYMSYVKEQENTFKQMETQKQDFKKTYFDEEFEYAVTACMEI
jgi:hypothetical protein